MNIIKQTTYSSAATVSDSEEHSSLPRFIGKSVRDVYKFRFALRNFVVNQLRTRYRKSFLGFLWSLLNPLMFMVVLAVVFATAFKQDMRTYGIYIFSGLIPWLFISQSILAGGQVFINAEGFLKKVYIPKLLFPLALVLTETVNFFFSLVGLYIFALALGSPLRWTMALLPLVILITFLFNLGCVIIIGIGTIYFRDLSHITVIVFQALFYLVPIIYQVDMFPEPARKLFYLNPFYYFINLFRVVIYGQPAMTWADWLIPLGFALGILLLALIVLKLRDREIVYRL